MNSEDLSHFRQQLKDLIIEAQRTDAVHLVDGIAKEIGYFEAINQVLEPILLEIGEMWAKENLSLAQGYVASKITEDVLLKALQNSDWQSKAGLINRPVVLANIEDDFHSLGRKMVSTFLQASGWKVHDLGNDVTAEKIVDAAVELNAPIIGISAMMYTTALNIKKVREEINRRKLQHKIKLAVGGAIFKVRPELTKEVGGDGTATSATNAPELFAKLYKTIKN